MSEIRAAADHCEIIIGKDYWPLPSYSEMLFYGLIEHTKFVPAAFLAAGTFCSDVFVVYCLYDVIQNREVLSCMISASSAAVLRD